MPGPRLIIRSRIEAGKEGAKENARRGPLAVSQHTRRLVAA